MYGECPACAERAEKRRKRKRVLRIGAFVLASIVSIYSIYWISFMYKRRLWNKDKSLYVKVLRDQMNIGQDLPSHLAGNEVTLESSDPLFDRIVASVHGKYRLFIVLGIRDGRIVASYFLDPIGKRLAINDVEVIYNSDALVYNREHILRNLSTRLTLEQVNAVFALGKEFAKHRQEMEEALGFLFDTETFLNRDRCIIAEDGSILLFYKDWIDR